MSRCRWGAIGTLIALAGACSDSISADCLSSGESEVCAVSDGGAIKITTAGLQPGSELVIEAKPGGISTYVVGPTGVAGSDGSIGFLSVTSGTEFEFSVAAVDADGEPFGGALTATT